MSELTESYSAASVFPAKLIKRKDLCVDADGNIKPVHAQICPTNKCNLNCPFCSCSEREKSQELELNAMANALCDLADLGMKAVTITGGGEPCLYPWLDYLIEYLHDLHVGVGLVSNGLALEKIDGVLNKVGWCRISVSDFRDVDKLLEKMAVIVPAANIDWAFSYVLTEKWEFEKFMKCLAFANEHKFTHVRLVADIMNVNGVPPMHGIKEDVRESGIDDSRVIYQARADHTHGLPYCNISLLKPLIAPDGYLYPCCGVQYAQNGNTGNFPENMRMCHISEIKDFYKKQVPFNGLVCDRCYYGDYNAALGIMTRKYDHEAWV
jgi:MoaA/NifB/PqqE/SkfB family radical SAM enzyme